tara:strand:+ start:1570 stop:1920 length:351 start_codon:yes stop_codon:yes gene_type:complete
MLDFSHKNPELEIIQEVTNLLGDYLYHTDDKNKEYRHELIKNHEVYDPDELLDMIAKKLHDHGLSDTDCSGMFRVINDLCNTLYNIVNGSSNKTDQAVNKLTKRYNLIRYPSRLAV